MNSKTALVLFLSIACLGAAAAEVVAPAEGGARAARADGLVVHEFGFLWESGISDDEVTVQDLLGDLPSHVRNEAKETPIENRTSTGEFVGGGTTGVPATVDVPVIPTTTTGDPFLFFYSDVERVVDVAVEFPDGRPVAWFPRTDDYRIQRLGWNEVKVSPRMPRGRNLKPFRDEGDKTKWQGLAAARKLPDVCTLEVGTQVEKYLFYEAAVSYPCSLLYSREDETGASWSLENFRSFDFHDLYVFPSRKDGTDRIAYVRELHAGEKLDLSFATTTGDEMSRVEWLAPADVPAHLASVAHAHGLYEAEAELFASTVLEPGFMKSPDRTAIYRLPDAEYDRIYPLTVEPAPAEVVRLGVVLVPDLAVRSFEHLTQVAALGKSMERRRAIGALAEIGDRSLPPLQDLRERARGSARKHLDTAIETVQAELTR